MSIMSWNFFPLLNIASANINEIAVVTFLLKMSSKKERLSRRTARDRSSNGKRTQWRTSAHVLPRLFSICLPSCIDFTWLSTCSRHVQLPFRTHLAIVAGYSNVNTHGCLNVSERTVWRNASQWGQGCHIAALHLEGEIVFLNKIGQKEYEK